MLRRIKHLNFLDTKIISNYNRFAHRNFSSKKDEDVDELKNKPFVSDDIEKQQQAYDSDSEDPQSFFNRKRKMFYYMTTGMIVLSGIYFGLTFLKKDDEKVKQTTRMGKVTYVGKPQIGGPFRLYDTKGNLLTHKDLSGKYYLIYFGFTQCPDVCPMSLNKISKVLDKIKMSKEYKYFDLECIFVSVDPDRDTPERIENYCKLFNKSIIGLTSKSNDDPDLKQMLKSFKIHSSKIYLSKEDEEADKMNLERNVPHVVKEMSQLKPKNDMKYSLDHTIVTYLMGPNNNFLTYLSGNLNQEEMYNIVVEEIMNDLKNQLKGLPVQKRI
jgi:cytochrome oxidase Cu insertion factor (SCO1/SenC/PrrC family)